MIKELQEQSSQLSVEDTAKFKQLEKQEKDLDKVQAMLQNFVDKVVVNSDQTAKIHLKIVCLALVPRTGIEPVRKFLSDGF